MGVSEKTKHNIALIILSLTAIVWGTGFVLSNSMLNNGFSEIPISLNALRFGSASVFLIAIFFRKIKFSKQLFLYGCIGGLMLFCGFFLQLEGLKYTTPASCGFFTAAYALFVPFITWIFLKKRPSLMVLVGVFCALAGLVVMNLPKGVPTQQGSNELLGNILTLGGSLLFAAQIVWADYALKTKQIDAISMTVVQVVTSGILFVLAALIFECKDYSTVTINWSNCWWKLCIVGLLGTAFAYFSQTYAQKHMAPIEISIVIACESPIGAVLSVMLGFEQFSWQLVVGGILVLLAVVLIEILPHTVKPAPKTDNVDPPDSTSHPDNNL